jgi:hypothetical protein
VISGYTKVTQIFFAVAFRRVASKLRTHYICYMANLSMGKIGRDGVERILEVPIGARPAPTVRLSRVMRQLGWQYFCARGLKPGSYRDRVRGYVREVLGHPTTLRLPNEF